jgi:hypothetical protein
LERSKITFWKTNVVGFLRGDRFPKEWLESNSNYIFLRNKGKEGSLRNLLLEIFDKDKIPFDDDFTEAQYKKRLKQFWADFEKAGIQAGITYKDGYNLLAQFWKELYCRNEFLTQDEEAKIEDELVDNTTDYQSLLRKLNFNHEKEAKNLATKHKEELCKLATKHEEESRKLATKQAEEKERIIAEIKNLA